MIYPLKSKRWLTLSWLFALALLAPVLLMVASSFYHIGIGQNETFSHLWQTVLPDYIVNTFLLAINVIVLATLFGVPAGAIMACTDIPGKSILRWLLLLPLAMPAYLVAYLYTDLFDYAGPVQVFLRGVFEWQSAQDYWFFDMRTLPGASVVIALVLYPYIYLLSRTAFEQQDSNLLKAAQLLGESAQSAFVKIAVPLARPAIATAIFLVLMETLADFATVHYFAVNTLTTAVYDTWLGYGDINAANGIASLLTLLVLFVVVAEQKARARKRHQSNASNQYGHQFHLTTIQKASALSFCWLLVTAGFLLPFALLLNMAFEYSDWQQVLDLLPPAQNSLKVAFISATGGVAIAIVLALFKRLHQSKSRALPQYLSGTGYAIPGTVLAMAVLASFGPLDHWINDIAASLNMTQPGLVLSGSIAAVIFAYWIRFAAIANGTIDSGLSQIPKNLDLAPASLGRSNAVLITKVHLPLLKKSLLLAFLLFFVEAMKELPAVLLLRPFNFETLATHIYQLISDELLEQGALGAILIVVFGLIPVLLLNNESAKERN